MARTLALVVFVLTVPLAVGCASSHRSSPPVDGGLGADLGVNADASASDAGHDVGVVMFPDAFPSPDADNDAGNDAGHDAGNDAGHDAGNDAGSDAGNDAGSDAGSDAGRDATVPGSDSGPLSGPTISFPGAGDTVHTLMTNYWNIGDYVEGSRTTTVASITHLMLALVVTSNTLTGDTQDMEILVNGIVVGTFMIHMGDTMVSANYTFPAIAGPTYTFRLQTTRTVNSGAGSAGFDLASSHIVIAP